MKVQILPEIKTKIQGAVSRGIKAVIINDEGHLIFTLTDNSVITLGSVNGAIAPAGPQGERGVGVANIVFNDDDTMTIVLTDGTEFTSNTLRGEKGDTGPKGENYVLTDSDMTTIAVRASKSLPDGSVSSRKLANDAVRIRTENVSVSVDDFSANNTFADFPYRAAISIPGATATMKPDITFDYEQATNGNFCPICKSYEGGVFIFVAEIPVTSFVIPVIDLWR